MLSQISKNKNLVILFFIMMRITNLSAATDGQYSYDLARNVCYKINQFCISLEVRNCYLETVIVEKTDAECIKLMGPARTHVPENERGGTQGPARPHNQVVVSPGISQAERELYASIGTSLGELFQNGSLLPDYGKMYNAANITVPDYYVKAAESLNKSIEDQRARLDASDNVLKDLLNKMSEKVNSYKTGDGYQVPRPTNISQADVNKKIAPILNGLVNGKYNQLVDAVTDLQMGYLNKSDYHGEQGLDKIGYYNNSIKGVISPARFLQLPFTTKKDIRLLTQPGTKEGVTVRQKINRLIALESTLNKKVYLSCIVNTCKNK